VAHDVDEQLQLTAHVVEQNVSVGDRVDEPRQIDHLAGFRSKRAATAAAEELQAAGYRIDGMRRRFLRVCVESSRETAVDHASAAAFTREVIGILDRHDGAYDGWGGFVRTGEPGVAPGA
jgi:regulator of RNase E activity RraB